MKWNIHREIYDRMLQHLLKTSDESFIDPILQAKHQFVKTHRSIEKRAKIYCGNSKQIKMNPDASDVLTHVLFNTQEVILLNLYVQHENVVDK